MKRKIVTRDEHGRTVEKWVDEGPMKVGFTRGVPTVRRAEPKPMKPVSMTYGYRPEGKEAA